MRAAKSEKRRVKIVKLNEDMHANQSYKCGGKYGFLRFLLNYIK